MAMDLLDQSSDRRDRHRVGADTASRELWATGRAGYPGAGDRRRRRTFAGMGPAAWQPRGMDQWRSDRSIRRRRAVRGRLRRLGAARAGADGADAAVQVAGVFVRYSREPSVLRGNVWRAVPAAAISANRARLRAVRRRPAAIACLLYTSDAAD